MNQNPQSNKGAKHKATYRIKGMDCEACAKIIELDLEDAGIKAVCNYAKETLEVETDDEDKVKEIIEKGGYKLIDSS